MVTCVPLTDLVRWHGTTRNFTGTSGNYRHRRPTKHTLLSTHFKCLWLQHICWYFIFDLSPTYAITKTTPPTQSHVTIYIWYLVSQSFFNTVNPSPFANITFPWNTCKTLYCTNADNHHQPYQTTYKRNQRRTRNRMAHSPMSGWISQRCKFHWSVLALHRLSIQWQPNIHLQTTIKNPDHSGTRTNGTTDMQSG